MFLSKFLFAPAARFAVSAALLCRLSGGRKHLSRIIPVTFFTADGAENLAVELFHKLLERFFAPRAFVLQKRHLFVLLVFFVFSVLSLQTLQLPEGIPLNYNQRNGRRQNGCSQNNQPEPRGLRQRYPRFSGYGHIHSPKSRNHSGHGKIVIIVSLRMESLELLEITEPYASMVTLSMFL